MNLHTQYVLVEGDNCENICLYLTPSFQCFLARLFSLVESSFIMENHIIIIFVPKKSSMLLLTSLLAPNHLLIMEVARAYPEY
jgi:hypothetical protein